MQAPPGAQMLTVAVIAMIALAVLAVGWLIYGVVASRFPGRLLGEAIAYPLVMLGILGFCGVLMLAL